MIYLKLACIVAAFSLLLIACGGQSTAPNTTAENVSPPRANAPVKTPEPLVENTLEAGKTLYANNCAKCHKEEGTGGKVEIEGKTLNAENLTKDKFVKMSDEKVIGIITDGIEDEGMPAFKNKLSDGEIKMIVRYVRTGIQKIPANPSDVPANNQ
jgi:mono/diheme cytochrome c family protein